MNNESKLTIKCPSGHEFLIDLTEYEIVWEIVEADEREMGTESLHESELNVQCDQCDEKVTLMLRIWEYPEGILNMQDIEINEGKVIEECDLTDLWQDRK